MVRCQICTLSCYDQAWIQVLGNLGPNIIYRSQSLKHADFSTTFFALNQNLKIYFHNFNLFFFNFAWSFDLKVKILPSLFQVVEKKPITSGSDANMVAGYQLFNVKGRSDQPKYLMRTQLAEQILTASTKDTKKAKYIFRPPSLKVQLVEWVGKSARKLYSVPKIPVPKFNMMKMPKLLLSLITNSSCFR